MTNLFLIPIILCYAGTAAILPIYIKKLYNGTSVKTLLMKMACSTLFVLCCVFSSLLAGTFGTVYSKYMLTGFLCSWLGDALLHRETKMIKYVFGGISFLAAHIFFIYAYMKTAADLFPGIKAVSVKEIIIVAVLSCVCIAVILLAKLKLNKLAVPIFIYAVVLMFMFVKASGLGFGLMTGGFRSGAAAFALLTAGALLFALSDGSLALGFFGEKSAFKRNFNIATYFLGQLLLATSAAFVAFPAE